MNKADEVGSFRIDTKDTCTPEGFLFFVRMCAREKQAAGSKLPRNYTMPLLISSFFSSSSSSSFSLQIETFVY